jgi:hypothetical protein
VGVVLALPLEQFLHFFVAHLVELRAEHHHRAHGRRRGLAGRPAAVADQGHPELDQGAGGEAGLLVGLGVADLAAQFEDRLGERVLDHLAAGGRQEAAPGRAGAVGHSLQLVGLAAEFAGGELPGVAVGAQLGRLGEDRVGGRVERVEGAHGRNRPGAASGRASPIKPSNIRSSS